MKRRIGAGTYLLAMSSATLVWSLAIHVACTGLAATGRIGDSTLTTLVSLSGTLFGVVFFALSAGRLRDLNFPGWAVKVLSFPLIAVIILPLLCFLSGSRWDHEYGEAPQPSGPLKTGLAFMLFLVAIFAANSAVLSYYHTRYQLRHAPYPATERTMREG
ncbi:DUF805 domain-containing protein [Paludibacterium paludis]|uniref:DUF805 domain-containing protein n=1 Tax=Paludibacterium paludis TaxID=1225769 RepID=A0A918P1B6_9NEIS|nr:DUF805 domain-containing protein [Paludibacterium paludis]GGY11879.1 hypothetical protein GCM10011289_13480 [Paludibacterium paludis]